MKTIEEILKEVEEKIETDFVTARFGNNWKNHAKENYEKDDIINIAWIQGRKALLLEMALKSVMSEIHSYGDLRFREGVEKAVDLCAERATMIQKCEDYEQPNTARFKANGVTVTVDKDSILNVKKELLK